MHRQSAFSKRQPGYAFHDETRHRVEGGEQNGDLLERDARANLSSDPVGRRFELGFDARVLLELDRSIGAGAARPVRIGQRGGRLEEI